MRSLALMLFTRSSIASKLSMSEVGRASGAIDDSSNVLLLSFSGLIYSVRSSKVDTISVLFSLIYFDTNAFIFSIFPPAMVWILLLRNVDHRYDTSLPFILALYGEFLYNTHSKLSPGSTYALPKRVLLAV